MHENSIALRNGEFIEKAVRSSGVSRATCNRIYTAMKRGDKESLHRLLNQLNNRTGRQPVIKKDEEELIKQRLRLAACRGLRPIYLL